MRQGGEHVEFAAVSVERLGEQLAGKRRQQRTMPRKAVGCSATITVSGARQLG